MKNRTLVKWLHWITFALMLYFLIDEPEVRGGAELAAKSDQLSIHAGMGMILGVVTLIWTVIYFRAGPLGRPGPKLSGWGKRIHRIVNSGLYWLLPSTVLTGAATGLTSTYPVLGFGVLPLNPTGWGNVDLNDLLEEVHELAFDATTLLIGLHIAFHLWRHIGLRDNALRIMAPKVLHRYL